jgi:hypothetical protein
VSHQVYLDNPNVLLEWDGDAGWIHVEYRRWFTTRETAEGAEMFLRAIREHHATRCLSDSRRRRVVQQEAQAVLTDSWVPQAAALGLRHLAIVLPESHLAQDTVAALLEQYRAHLEARSFATVAEATTWLRADGAPAGATAPVAKPAEAAG